MKTRLLAVAAAAAMAAHSAVAADYPVYPVSAPIYRPLPRAALFSWTGCYVGGNLGAKWVGTSGSVDIAPVTGLGVTNPGASLGFNDHIAGSFVAGAQVGCNYQVGTLVFGIEGDVDGQHWHFNRTFDIFGDSFDMSSRWQASLRGRIGHAWDRILLYATGGVAWTNVRLTTNFPAVFVGPVLFPATSASDSPTLVGATIGGGVEHAFLASNLTLAVEGRYTWYGTHTFNSGLAAAIGGPPFIFAPVTTSVKLNTAEGLIKLNYRFGGPIVY